MPGKGRPPQAIPSPISRHIITCYVRYQGSIDLIYGTMHNQMPWVCTHGSYRALYVIFRKIWLHIHTTHPLPKPMLIYYQYDRGKYSSVNDDTICTFTIALCHKKQLLSKKVENRCCLSLFPDIVCTNSSRFRDEQTAPARPIHPTRWLFFHLARS